MTGPVLVLWALLLGPGAVPPGWAGGRMQPGANLSCYRCFKVTRRELCTPTVCASTDMVCVSHSLTFFLHLGENVLLSKRCAPRCPNNNSVYEWLSGTRMLRRITRQCCNQSLCNAGPPTPGQPWALAGVLLLPLGFTLPGALL